MASPQLPSQIVEFNCKVCSCCYPAFTVLFAAGAAMFGWVAAAS